MTMSDILMALQARIAAFEAEMTLLEIKGGPGSGNWGHAGRPGHRGGSTSRGGGGGGGPKRMRSSAGFSGGAGTGYTDEREKMGREFEASRKRDADQANEKQRRSQFGPDAPQAKPGAMKPGAAPKAKYQFTPGSAGEKYEQNRRVVVDNVDRMEQALRKFEQQQKRDPKNWGFAGSLAGLASHLNDNGVRVSDPPLAATAADQFRNRAKQVKKQLSILKKVKPADRNTDWTGAGDIGNLASVSRDAMTYLIDEDEL